MDGGQSPERGAGPGGPVVTSRAKNLADVFMDEHSEQLHDYKVKGIAKFVHTQQDGIYYHDIQHVTTILSIAARYVLEGMLNYEGPTVALVGLLGRPFLSRRVTDERGHEANVSALLQTTTTMLRIPNLRQPIGSMILSFLTHPKTKKGHLQLFETIESASLVVDALVACSTLDGTAEETLACVDDLLSVLRIMATSTSLCTSLVETGVVALLVPPEMSERPVDDVRRNRVSSLKMLEILSTMLDTDTTHAVRAAVNDPKIVRAMTSAFKSALKSCSYTCKGVCLEIMYVVEHMADDPASRATIMDGGMFDAIVTTGLSIGRSMLGTGLKTGRSSCEVLGKQGGGGKRQGQGPGPVELAWITTAVSLATILIDQPQATKRLKELRFLEFLFQTIDMCDVTIVSKKDPRHVGYLNLLRQTNSILPAVIPKFVDEFVQENGCARILTLAECAMGMSGALLSHFSKPVLDGCLGIIVTLCSLPCLSNQMATLFAQAGAVDVLLSFLDSDTGPRPTSEQLDARVTAFMSVSLICAEHPPAKVMFGCRGVHVVIKWLKRNVGFGFTQDQKDTLAAVQADCLWNCVVGSQGVEDEFLSHEGAFILLDILEESSQRIRSVLFGSLLDLMENDACLRHVREWRSRRDGRTSAMQLLINLWIEEETRLGVTVLEGSVLAHKTNPFYTLAQDSVEPEPVPKPASDPSPSILEVGDNIRAKVYSVFCKMGWDSDARLSSEHKVKLVAIKKYLEFKHGEVMHEIATELVLENTRPVTPDQELLDLAAQVTKKITASVQDEQHRLLHEAHQQGLRTEHDLYESVKAHRKVQTSEEHKFKEFIIRTSNRSALKAAQHKRAEAIRRSRRATSRSTSPSEPRDQACAFPCDSTFTGLSQSGGSSQPSACASNASMKREDYDVHVLADFEDLGLSMSSIAGDDIFSACDESVAIKVPAMPPQPPPPFLPRLANKCS